MKKSEIETRWNWKATEKLPCINVKCHNFHLNSKVEEHFKCSEKQAEKALEFVWNCSVERFWVEMTEIAWDIFGKSAEVYSVGRCGGHLVVEGLDDLESWGAIMVSKWAKFEKIVKEEIKYLSSWEYVQEEIEMNQWHKEGAEQYNFMDGDNGEPICIADLKAQAKEAGFGPVVRW